MKRRGQRDLYWTTHLFKKTFDEPKKDSSGILRPILELLDTSKKCGRLGHSPVPEKRRIRRMGDHRRREAAVDYRATFYVCERCGEELDGPVNEEHITSYTSCSMANSRWDEIREKGYCLVEE